MHTHISTLTDTFVGCAGTCAAGMAGGNGGVGACGSGVGGTMGGCGGGCGESRCPTYKSQHMLIRSGGGGGCGGGGGGGCGKSTCLTLWSPRLVLTKLQVVAVADVERLPFREPMERVIHFDEYIRHV